MMNLRGRFQYFTCCLAVLAAASVLSTPALGQPIDEKAISGITPNSAWIFGGVVAEIEGRDFTPNAQVYFGDAEAEVLAVSEDGEVLWVVVPPLPTDVTDAAVIVDVLVRDLERDSRRLQGFSYVQRALEDNLVVHAFFFDPAAEFTGAMSLGGGLEAIVTIPVAERAASITGTVAGLFRAGDNPLSLGTSVVTGVPPVSSFREFDVHLYEPIPGALPLQPGAETIQEIVDWSYPESEETQRITVDVPLPSVNLQTNDVQRGLTLWRVRTQLDYNTLIDAFLEFPFVVFETFVLGADTVPDAATSLPGLDLETLRVRMNGTGAIALRRNTLPPPNVGEAVVVDAGAATSGDVAGGTTLRLLAPLGGLAWVDRVEFQTVTGDLVATATADNFLTDPGTTGQELALTVPPADCSGTVNLAVYLKARPQISFVILPQAFTYTGDAPPCGGGEPGGGCPAAASLAPPAPPTSGDALVLLGVFALLSIMAVTCGRHRVAAHS